MIKDKLIEKQKELIKFYGERLADNAVFLHIHHMAETPENCRIGEILRNEITELEKQIDEPSKGAEEIRKKIVKEFFDCWGKEPFSMRESKLLSLAIEAMEQYRAERLKEINENLAFISGLLQGMNSYIHENI
jgi:hypothetical protein